MLPQPWITWCGLRAGEEIPGHTLREIRNLLLHRALDASHAFWASHRCCENSEPGSLAWLCSCYCFLCWLSRCQLYGHAR